MLEFGQQVHLVAGRLKAVRGDFIRPKRSGDGPRLLLRLSRLVYDSGAFLIADDATTELRRTGDFS